jgi:hypothetical protein
MRGNWLTQEQMVCRRGLLNPGVGRFYQVSAHCSYINIGLVPYARNDAFVGREAVLNQLRSQLLKTASRRVSLFGLGGIG